MDTTALKYPGAVLALALCSACASGLAQPQGNMAATASSVSPSVRYVGKTLSVNGRLATAARAPSGSLPRYQTMLPTEHAKPDDFEYIINEYGTYAGVFDYPKSDAQIGKIDNVGGQGCTNVLYGYGKGIIWIVAGEKQITEYQLLKKPIKTLSDSIGKPSSCAMNTSGDLAVGILYGSEGGDVVIYKDADRPGTIYTTPLVEEYFDGYDDRGNLFADGFTSSGFFGLVELPAGTSKFRPIATSNSVLFPGSVQWDGKFLTVFDQQANAFYQYTVNGSTATLQGTVTLDGSSDCAQTWIVPHLAYCADAGTNDGEVFHYPAGGSPVATFTGTFDLPLGTVAARK